MHENFSQDRVWAFCDLLNILIFEGSNCIFSATSLSANIVLKGSTTFFVELLLNPLYACFNALIISALRQAEFWKQASNYLMWDAFDDVEPTADTESTGAVIITGSEVLLGSLVMFVTFFSLEKFFNLFFGV